ncbi:uncharacterized protein DEA37_0011012 [Paragonimus westermani]|uniref:Uncharacterized protein n=1 Tax=Paragonimus westermani TaxID=34504 RepID=A0A5J4NUY0_9TREM|nr:uncharacterized protein DEA37_0011012 [Paragonimus westermani]
MAVDSCARFVLERLVHCKCLFCLFHLFSFRFYWLPKFIISESSKLMSDDEAEDIEEEEGVYLGVSLIVVHFSLFRNMKVEETKGMNVMDMVKPFYQMVILMRDTMRMERDKVKEFIGNHGVLDKNHQVVGKGRYLFPHLSCQQTGEYLVTPAKDDEKTADDVDNKMIPRWKASKIENISDEAKAAIGEIMTSDPGKCAV